MNTYNNVFKDHIRKFILVFFDDILVYSFSWSEHLQHLETILRILQTNQFFVKKSKCSFGQRSVEYLGHVISEKGVEVDWNKIKSMIEWPTPKFVKSLRGFLGLTGYYRKFVQDYGIRSKLFTDLLKRDNFKWGNEAQDAFEFLKKDMSRTPVLVLPDFSKQFVVETNASGAVLMQGGRPLAYLSKKFSPGRKGYLHMSVS